MNPISTRSRAPLAALLLVLAAALWAPPARAAQFTSIAPGLNHTCATKADGTAWCWGEGRQGQVGVIGAVRPRVPVYVIGSYETTAISSGQSFWCGLLRSREISCSGLNTSGQIGSGNSSTAQYPAEVALKNVTRVSAGVKTACAVHDGGLLSCWGDSQRGQVGDGVFTREGIRAPTPVPGLSGISEVAVGDTHVCAVRGDGQVLCWGDTADGKLGNGINSEITRPGVPVTGLTGAVSVAVGGRHSCALRGDGTVWCWGSGVNGQLGDGQTTQRSDVARKVPALEGVTQIAAMALTTCAVKRDGTAVCWGDGTNGQIGNGSRANALSPQPVRGITDAAQIGVGTQHACLVTRTQTPFCWGRNGSGQLGTGATLRTVSLEPQLVQDYILGPATFLPADQTEIPAGSKAGGAIVLKELELRRNRTLSCPKTATVRVTARGRTAVRRGTVAKVRNGCTISGRFLLAKNTENATKASYRITGTKLRTERGSLRARTEDG